MTPLKKNLLFLLSALFIALGAGSCAKKKDSGNPVIVASNPPPPAITASTSVKGYNLLAKICGIWNGPVTSTTPLGGYPEWIVDFRPIGASQVSAKNELDTANSIFMSFFIVYHNSEYKLAFRNGGTFNSMNRTAYMVADSVSENGTSAYYRFVDFVKGGKRTITEVIFNSDSLRIRSFTNKYNTLSTPTIHMDWKAALRDTSSCQPAKTAFKFPQKTLVKDFSNTFSGLTESVYYQTTNEPYPESQQPYLGQSSLSYTVIPSLTLNPAQKVFIIVTTQPLFPGGVFSSTNLKYRSRYVILQAKPTNTFLFNYMHPGSYFLYAFYDANGNGLPDSGDFISTANTQFSSPVQSATSATTQINFTIP